MTATRTAGEAGKVKALFPSRPQSRCPWNPFPARSPWGRKLDEMYRLDQAKAARRHAALAEIQGRRDG